MSFLVEFNPLYHLIAIVREPMLGKAPEPLNWIIVLLITLIGWLVAVRVLTRFRHRIVYWL